MTLLWMLYTVGSPGICSHDRLQWTRAKKIMMLDSNYQTSPIAIDSVSSLSLTPLLPSNPTQLPCRVFYSAAVFSPHSFFPNQHPCSTHQPPLRKLQAGWPGMKCWQVVQLLASLVYHKRSDAIKFLFPQRLKRACLCEHAGGG